MTPRWSARPSRRANPQKQEPPSLKETGASRAAERSRTSTPCGYKNLNLARLPIPPQPRSPGRGGNSKTTARRVKFAPESPRDAASCDDDDAPFRDSPSPARPSSGPPAPALASHPAPRHHHFAPAPAVRARQNQIVTDLDVRTPRAHQRPIHGQRTTRQRERRQNHARRKSLVKPQRFHRPRHVHVRRQARGQWRNDHDIIGRWHGIGRRPRRRPVRPVAPFAVAP